MLFSMVAFLAAWLLPNHYFPWAMAYQEFLSFFAGLLLVLVVILARSYRAPLSCIFFCFLPFIPLLQAVTGVVFFGGDAWVAAFYLCGFAAMLFVGYSLARHAELRADFVRGIAGVFVVGAVLSVGVALYQWLILPSSIWVADMQPGGRPFANLAQPNNLATLLCMGLVGVIYFYEKGLWGGVASGILVFFLLFGIALTQSRTPWVGFFVVAVFWVWKSRVSPSRLSLNKVICWLFIYIACVLVLPFLADFLSLPHVSPLDRAQSLERWDMWGQFWHAVLLQPLWGYGWNQVSVAQVAVSLAHPVSILTEHSHNIVLDVLLWNGLVVGGFGIIFIVIWLARIAWRVRSIEGRFALLAICFLLVHALLEFPLEYAFFLLPFGLLLGIAVADCPVVRELSVSRWGLVSVLLVGMAFWGWIWSEYRILEEDHRLMRFESAQIGNVRAVQPTPNVVFLTQLREFVRFARTPASVGMDASQLEWMRKVAHRYPYASSLFRYSLALALNDQFDVAREQMLILRALHGDKYYAEGWHSLRDMSVVYPQLDTLLQSLPSVER